MHEEVRDLLGVYALDALDPEERAAVAAHLVECPECREEVEQHLEVASILGGADQTISANSWDAIAARISDAEHVVVPLWRRPRVLLAAAAVLVVALGASLIAQTVRLADARSGSVAGLDDVVAEALQHDTTMLMTLGSESSDSTALVAFQPDGTGYLVRHSLPALSSDRTYQLWAIVEGRVISAGVLGNDPGIVPFRIDPDGLAAFAITEEVAGGVVASENEAVVAWLAA